MYLELVQIRHNLTPKAIFQLLRKVYVSDFQGIFFCQRLRIGHWDVVFMFLKLHCLSSVLHVHLQSPPHSYFHRGCTHGTRKICHLTLFPIFWKALSSTAFTLHLWQYDLTLDYSDQEGKEITVVHLYSLLHVEKHDFPHHSGNP